MSRTPKAPAPPRSSRPVATEMQQLFGENLKRAREAADMTQEQLADAAGAARSYVSQIEKGQENITFALAKALGDAVGCSVRALLDPAGETPDEALSVGTAPAHRDTLAIELPSPDAFRAAQAAASELNRQITLIAPQTRAVVAVVTRPKHPTKPTR